FSAETESQAGAEVCFQRRKSRSFLVSLIKQILDSEERSDMPLQLVPAAGDGANVARGMIDMRRQSQEIRVGTPPDSHCAEIPSPSSSEVVHCERSGMFRTAEKRRACLK